MKSFKVTIEEVLSKTIIIEADNINEAYNMIKLKYRNEEIVLDANDFIGKAEIFIHEE